MSNVFIPNEKLRRAFRKRLDANGYSQLNVMGLVACKAAYEHGEEWYEAMRAYVKANIDFTAQYVEENLPGVTMTPTEGTYLVWLDFRQTGLGVDELEDLIIHKAKLWLDSGKIFGESGRGFQRINVACPRTTVKEALDRIKTALEER
jgi:cystathionine beta-lyase